MHNISGSKDENSPGAITRTPVALAWGRGRTISQIAAETGLSVEVVLQNLKTLEKAIVENEVKSHETEDEL